MTDEHATIVVVDDDSAMREAIHNLLASVGLKAREYPSVPAFLAAPAPDGPWCLILDIRMPGRSGLDLQEDLAKAGVGAPIIFITGHGDIPMTVRAMKAGAVEFLAKPFRDQDLLDAIQLALDRDREQRLKDARMAGLKGDFETLTGREKEVMGHVVLGLLNKQIAAALKVSEITVKVHRGQVMRKMKARSLAELVRMADSLGLPATR